MNIWINRFCRAVRNGIPACDLKIRVSLLVCIGVALAQGASDGWTYHQLPMSTPKISTFFNGRYILGMNHGFVQSSVDGATWALGSVGNICSNDVLLNTGSKLAVLGDSGLFGTSTDGVAWKGGVIADKPRIVSAVWNDTEALALSKEGRLYRSKDLDSWMRLDSAAPVLSAQLAWNGDERIWVIFTDSGKTYTSPDALRWTAVGTRGPKVPSKVVYFNGRYFATQTTVPKVFIADDLSSWTIRNAKSCYIVDRRIFLDEGSYITTSTDGAKWSSRSNGCFGSASANNIVAGDSGFLYVTPTSDLCLLDTNFSEKTSSEQILTPLNGLVPCQGGWLAYGSTSIKSGTDLDSLRPEFTAKGKVASIACGDSAVVTTSQYPREGGDSILVRYHGKWRAAYLGTGGVFRKAFWTGSEFVLLGGSAEVYSSPRGLVWREEARYSSRAENLGVGIAIADSILVVVNSTQAFTSINWGAWSASSPLFPSNVFTMSLVLDVAWGNGMFLAVGIDSTFASSKNGLNWTRADSKLGRWYRKVVFGDGQFFVGGDSGEVARSRDGKTWTRWESLPDDIVDLVIHDGKLVVVGKNGLIASRSTDSATAGVGKTRRTALDVPFRRGANLVVPVGPDVAEGTLVGIDGKVRGVVPAVDGEIVVPQPHNGRFFLVYREGGPGRRRTVPLFSIRH